MEDHASRLHAFCLELVSGLRDAGVEQAVVSPGYRSGPIAIAARRAGLDVHVQIDERSGAFYGLGLAKASRSPVALIATSGTAAANYLPAVVEAGRSGERLVVLTADRPPELRGWGSNQTVDQIGLYGSHVRWFAELPVASEVSPAVARSFGFKAGRLCTAPVPGPVHLNVPIREPLRLPDAGFTDAGLPYAGHSDAGPRGNIRVAPVEARIGAPSALLEAIERFERGVIVAGAIAPGSLVPDDVLAVGSASGWPILAEPVSQLRVADPAHGATVVSTGSFLTDSPSVMGSLEPDVMLVIGAPSPTRAMRRWIASGSRRVFAMATGPEWFDESHVATDFIELSVGSLFAGLRQDLALQRKGGTWARAWARADADATEAIGSALIDAPLFEGRVVTAMAGALPDDTALFAGNSMAVRDLDSFWPRREIPIDIYSNRGASGIDGVVSTALGVAAGRGAPVALLLGDLSLLHDMSGLLAAARLGAPLVVVVVDNNGGGLFSQLPMATAPGIPFEELFTTPHATDIGSIVRGLGLVCEEVDSSVALQAALLGGLELGRPAVIRVGIDRALSAGLHAEIAASVRRAVGAPT